MAEDPKAPETQPVPALPAPLPEGAHPLPDPGKKGRRVRTVVTIALALVVTVGTAMGVPVCSIAQSWGFELVRCPVAPAAPAP